MKRNAAYWFILSAFFLLSCGGGSGGDHSLQGTWEGHLVPGGALTLNIDGDGVISEILINGSASSTFLGGEVDDGPDIYTMTWIVDFLGPIPFPFLTDTGQLHAAIAPMFGSKAFIGALEKGGASNTIFLESDVVDSWSGYGYGYSQDALGFIPFSPVTVSASSGASITFTVTMPGGAMPGELTDFANLVAFWGGNAVTGASAWVVMTPDKQFVAVESVPVVYSSLEDVTFFALNRDP